MVTVGTDMVDPNSWIPQKIGGWDGSPPAAFFCQIIFSDDEVFRGVRTITETKVLGH